MDENKITQQLNTEIEKLKEHDYTSYQSFYYQTSNYLYGIIWNIVQDQSIADSLINELYTEIYSSIATELTDNSQFYAWAENKAQSITTTYLTTHELSGGENLDNERRAEVAAVAVALNTGMDMSGGNLGSGMADGTFGIADKGLDSATNIGMGSSTGGATNIGMGSSTGGAANIGMNSGTYGADQAGISMTPTALAQSGISTVANGIGQSGVSATAEAMGSGNTAGAGLSSGSTHAGLSIGAKLAIGIASIALLVGGGIGIHAMVNSDKEETNVTTTEIVASVTEDVDTEATGGVTTEEITDTTTEELLENPETDKVERYAAYYDVVKTYMQDYPYQPVVPDHHTGFLFAKLVDFNHEDKEQLIIAYSEKTSDAWYDITYTVKIFDYADGQATEVTTINTSKIGFSEEEGSIALWTTEGTSGWWDLPESYKVVKTMYKYEGGSFVAKHTYIEEVIIKDDFSLESETGYVDNEVRPVDEVRALISGIDERSDNYAFWYDINTNAKPLLTKHVTMDLLAEVSGDTEFVNTVSNVEASVEDNGASYTYTYSANKYNESYANLEYSPDSAPETSADLMTVRNYWSSNRMSIENAEICYTFYHDVLLVTGYEEPYTNTYYWADEEAYLKQSYYPMNDDSNIVAVDEYNANAQELINK